MSPALAGRFFTTTEAQLSFFKCSFFCFFVCVFFFFFFQKSGSEPGTRAGWSQYSLTTWTPRW